MADWEGVGTFNSFNSPTLSQITRGVDRVAEDIIIVENNIGRIL